MDAPFESSLHVEPCVHEPVLGWLLFLCVALTLLAPAGEIHNIFEKLIPLFMRVVEVVWLPTALWPGLSCGR